jgi:hypothetical protein
MHACINNCVGGGSGGGSGGRGGDNFGAEDHYDNYGQQQQLELPLLGHEHGSRVIVPIAMP